MLRTSLIALTFLATMVTSLPAVAGPHVTAGAEVGTTLDADDLVAATALARLGLQSASNQGLGAFAECGASRFAGFGPQSGWTSGRCLGAVSLTFGSRALRWQPFLGLGYEWRRRPAEVTGLMEREAAPEFAAGVGAVFDSLRLTLEARQANAPQLQLTVGFEL